MKENNIIARLTAMVTKHKQLKADLVRVNDAIWQQLEAEHERLMKAAYRKFHKDTKDIESSLIGIFDKVNGSHGFDTNDVRAMIIAYGNHLSGFTKLTRDKGNLLKYAGAVMPDVNHKLYREARHHTLTYMAIRKDIFDSEAIRKVESLQADIASK